MKKHVTLLSKCLGASILCFALSLSLNAQNLVSLGDMPANGGDEWTMGWRSGSIDDSSVDFGVETDVPAGAVSTTAASIKFASSGWNETQLWQVISLTGGVEYFLNAKLKISIPEANTWVQGFLMPYEEPSLADQNAIDEPQLITAVELLQTHDWTSTSEETITFDGDFPKNVAHNDKFTFGTSVTPEADGDYFVLFKLGGGVDSQTASITDVDVSDGTASVLNAENRVFKVYPSNADEYIKVSGIRNAASAKIFSIMGSMVSNNIVRNVERIDVSDLAAGIYVIQIEEGLYRGTQKFVKQ